MSPQIRIKIYHYSPWRQKNTKSPNFLRILPELRRLLNREFSTDLIGRPNARKQARLIWYMNRGNEITINNAITCCHVDYSIVLDCLPLSSWFQFIDASGGQWDTLKVYKKLSLCCVMLIRRPPFKPSSTVRALPNTHSLIISIPSSISSEHCSRQLWYPLHTFITVSNLIIMISETRTRSPSLSYRYATPQFPYPSDHPLILSLTFRSDSSRMSRTKHIQRKIVMALKSVSFSLHKHKVISRRASGIPDGFIMVTPDAVKQNRRRTIFWAY